MNLKLESLARDKESLLARSALCRMRMRRQAQGLRESLRLRRAAGSIVASPVTYRVAFSLVVAWVGLARSARIVLLAGRVVAYAKLASSVIDCAREFAIQRSFGARVYKRWGM